MDVKRAKEIMGANKPIEVLYQGSPVWIENVRDANNTADITNLQTSEKINVPVYLLIENNPVT